MNPGPEFPLLSFDEQVPIEKAAIGITSSETFGLVVRRDYAEGCPWLKATRYYSRNGFRYRVTHIDPEPKFSRMQKFLARVWRPWDFVKVDIALEYDGPWEVGPIKQRIRGMLDHDPGDLLYQWTDDEEWNRGLTAAATPAQLIDFLMNVALVDHDDPQQNDN